MIFIFTQNARPLVRDGQAMGLGWGLITYEPGLDFRDQGDPGESHR